eukprot:239069-Hanusia_phi.AAC.2
MLPTAFGCTKEGVNRRKSRAGAGTFYLSPLSLLDVQQPQSVVVALFRYLHAAFKPAKFDTVKTGDTVKARCPDDVLPARQTQASSRPA